MLSEDQNKNDKNNKKSQPKHAEKNKSSKFKF